MRTRFKKVWCGSCATMQFAGECGHGRLVGSSLYLFPALTGADVAGLQLRAAMRRPLVLPDPTIWTLHEPRRSCSCSRCSIGAPCIYLAGA